MRILLPPSEAKSPGGTGRSLAARTRPEPLAEPRAHVIEALNRLLGQADAGQALLIPASASAEALRHNSRVWHSPTVPALQRYRGVLYDGLDHPGLTERAARLARTSVLIFSGLLGVVRGGDPVPDYRVPAKATLPGLGIVGTFWRSQLASGLPALLGNGLVVDLRSTDYAAMWQPDRTDPVAERLISVRVLSPRPDGSLGVISYPSKFHKGRLAAALLERDAAGAHLSEPEHLIDVWTGSGGKDGRVVDSRTGRTIELITHTSTVV